MMREMRFCWRVLLLLAFTKATAWAQHTHANAAPAQSDAAVQSQLGFMAIGLTSRVSPAYVGRTFTEGYLSQPNLMGGVHWKRLDFTGTLNAEAYTLRRGELTPGIYGEGYVDRRHPHTMLHEAMLSLSTHSAPTTGFSASLSAGKGFVSYGTDDPMMRPFVKYPVNHHHSQILERAQVIAAVRFATEQRDVALEYAVFNGDEPTGPFASPTISRVGDSRAIRLTVRPMPALEFQASRAYVESPDVVRGIATNHEQISVSTRFERQLADNVSTYALAEFARTDDTFLGERHFRYETVLVEGMLALGNWVAAARWEGTDRPEQSRLLDPFRTQIGHIHFQINGMTRWKTTTLQLRTPGFSSDLGSVQGGLSLVPFVEVAHAAPRAVIRPTVFVPAEFYGSGSLWTYSVGLRLHMGTMRPRMGRYGVAQQFHTAGPSHH